jgi:hypothetical protein
MLNTTVPFRLHAFAAKAAVLVSATLCTAAMAEQYIVPETTILGAAVNGGTDTVNPGTSCVRLSSPVAPVCTAGYIAVPNNNKQLLSAALQARGTGSTIWIYYADGGNFHCPGLVFTPCGVISIELK